MGFDRSQAPSDEGHYGLNGMAERLAALDGELEIQSSAEEGTELRVHVPLTLNGSSKT